MRLLAAAEYDKRTVTLMHRRLGAPENFVGMPVEQWLDTLTGADASSLITKLQAEVS